VESHDTLVLIAEIAVGLAGFSSVVVALDNRAVRDWSVVRRFNLRILLQVSAIAIFFSLFPLIFERVVEPPTSWRWACFAYGTVHLIDVGTFALRLPIDAEFPPRLTSRMGVLIALCQLLVATLGSLQACEVTYLTVLVWHLSVAAMGFALLVYSSDGATGSP
jgi:hypothetical protein